MTPRVLGSFVLMASGLWLGGAAAGAQVPVGKFGQREVFTSRVAATEKMAGCVVGREQERAERFVVADSASDQEQLDPALKRAMVACLGQSNSLTVRSTDFRGALAEWLLKDQGGARLSAARNLAVAVPQRVASIESGAGPVALFDCVVRANPASAVTMIEARPESPEEAQAFQAIVPALQACAPATGALRIKPYEVRLWVASSLYRQVAKAPGA